MNKLTRRAVIRAAGGALTLVVGGLQVACTTEESEQITAVGLDDTALLTLLRTAQLLLPHQSLSADVYRDAMLELSGVMSSDARKKESVNAGIAALNKTSPWLDLSPAEQREALAGIESTPFFAVVREAAIAGVYRDERTWQLLGYEGEASKFGGYLHRGFNDIDWLPESGGEQ